MSEYILVESGGYFNKSWRAEGEKFLYSEKDSFPTRFQSRHFISQNYLFSQENNIESLKSKLPPIIMIPNSLNFFPYFSV
jgi:hypothetical protein